MTHRTIILNFIYKFFCILKAASDGWIIRYIGGNQFEFISNTKMDINLFLDKYTRKLPNIITQI